MLLRRIGPLLLFILLAPSGARGQVRQAAEERIRLLNKKAMEEYDSLEFDAARATLEEALQVAKDNELANAKITAQIYLNLGVVHGAGLNDRINAVKSFTEALIIESEIALDPMRATPALEEMFTGAKENAAQAAKPKDATFKHNPVDEVAAGQPVRVLARVGEGLQASKVLLFFRRVGGADFSSIEMSTSGPGTYLGIIPAAQVQGRSIYYYLEAQDDAGQRLEGHGTAISPNIITVRGEPGPGPGPGPVPGKKRKMVSIGLMVGTGGGFVYGGRTDNVGASIEKTDDDQVAGAGPGGAFAPFHLSPEIAYHINDKWHIGVLGRIQVVNALPQHQQIVSKVSFLGVLRAKRFFGGERLRFYLGFGAGGGQIRHRIPLNQEATNPNEPPPEIDTRAAGYIAFSVGGGINYMFSEYVGLAVDLDGLILVPDFTAHLDLNLGLLVCF